MDPHINTHTIDDVSEMLGDIVDDIPADFFNELNGGVVLLEECKFHPSGHGDLVILGEYHHNRAMGRYIYIYYGSFMRLYRHLPKEVLKERLRDTLIHEFTHHLESLAGERNLELHDQVNMDRYKRAREIKRRRRG